MSLYGYAREFHRAFLLDMDQEFDPDADLFALRCRLLGEETLEVMGAKTRAELAKELADVVYVAAGTAMTYGVDLDWAIRLVHESNMTKLHNGKPLYRADGKVLKGPSYRGPDLGHL